MNISRREFLKIFMAGTGGLFLATNTRRARWVRAAIPGGTLDPTLIPKFIEPLVIPPAMPSAGRTRAIKGKNPDYYVIAVRQFEQFILPASMGLPTTVWSYGSANHPWTFNYPAFTIEARWNRPVRVKWINDLVDTNGDYLPHLLPVDQTLHWANPPGPRDAHGMMQEPYMGPVPLVTHVHGAHTDDESDGYAEAWFLPKAGNIPSGYYETGTWYDFFKNKFLTKHGVTWEPGSATFQYPNVQRAATLWYHDHALGATRTNVYAGPAGFYLVRGGPDDIVGGRLPGPAPVVDSNPFGVFYEIPIAIQDRAFNADGSLFYPDNRAFFEGLNQPPIEPYLDIPFHPDPGCDGEPSDVAPIWNPEFFGNTIVVNGRTWPYLDVEQRRYRLRLLNGCQGRFLILKMDNGLPFYQIGTEGGFLPEPVELDQLLMSPAERADVIVDFTNLPVGTTIILKNIGPDEPFGGGIPGVDFPTADPDTTGQVSQFRIVAATSVDTSTPAMDLKLPKLSELPAATITRQVSLNEAESENVFVTTDGNGNVIQDCGNEEEFSPVKALLGIVDSSGSGSPLGWDDPITENPELGATEVWEIHNFTVDAHPIHIHELMFEVVDRQSMETGEVREPEAWESGRKDTVIAYPEEITRIKATFDISGQYVWHCHIVEHEDHEMMRPFRIGPEQPGQPEP